MKNAVLILLSSLLLWSCAASPPKYSNADIAAATSREQQTALYESIRAELAQGGSSSNTAAYQRLLDDLGQKLGEEEATRIRDTLAEAKLDSGFVPLSVLAAAESSAEPIRQWNPAAYNDLIGELQALQSAAAAELEYQRTVLNGLDRASDEVLRVECLGQIAALQGDNSEADTAYKVAYEDLFSRLESDGQAAMARSDFPTALQAYRDLQRLNPEYPGIGQLIADAQAGVASADFRQLLIDGDIEGAYREFLRLSEQPLPVDQKDRFMGSANNLALFFGNNATSMVNAGLYDDAYTYIKREIGIRDWMNEPSQISPATVGKFADAMFDLSVASSARDRFGLEYGYLLLVEEFEPGYSTLESRKRDAQELVYNHSIRRVGSVSISSPDPADQQIASQIAAGVRQYLMQNIPEDVKLVERERLEDVRKERGMSDDLDPRAGEPDQLESADYLIQGELLIADVASEVNRIRNRKRVVTGEVQERNPDYDDWIKAKGIRKADHPDAPPKTVPRTVQEDIELTVEEHRKFGEVGVTYRVIDTGSAELMHTESISRSVEVSDESREGVQYGEFVQEAKLAQLPSDIEIFADLVDKVVDAMAKDLVAFLANPEGDYFKKCQELRNEGENTEAAEYCASAAVLREYKALENSEVIAELKRVTLGSGMRAD